MSKKRNKAKKKRTQERKHYSSRKQALSKKQPTPKPKNRYKLITAIIAAVLLLTAGASVLYYAKFYKEDLNKRLPVSVTVSTKDPGNIAYALWDKYMRPYEETINPFEKLDARYMKFEGLKQNQNGFSIDIDFNVKLQSKKWSAHRSWGKVQPDGIIQNIKWTLNVKKTGADTYILQHIGKSQPSLAGSGQSQDTNGKTVGDEHTAKQDTYEIDNGKLKVTYDHGQHWMEVPVSVSELFQGDYSGPKDTLIDGSYVISANHTAFILGEGMHLRILQSTDQGMTWKETSVQSPIKGIRLRQLGFTSEQNGYLILTGDRTMTTEGNVVMKTHNGGETWESVGHVNTGRLATGGGFSDNKLGFMSFGSRGNPAHPVLYRTIDGGKSWHEVQVVLPAKYRGIFTVAQVPFFTGSKGTLLVTQGQNGDYQGGQSAAKFISNDRGATWLFTGVVNPG